MDESDRTNAEGRALAATIPNRDLKPHHPTGRDIGRVTLAHEAPIRRGALSIEPALRRVAHDDGREEIVEPRVMQVLVALIRADGKIVSRDDLLMSCWHGVVVGEDAITRVIGRLRRLADGIGEGAFKLETITKVGYRLQSTDPPAKSEPSALPPDSRSLAPAATIAEPLLAVLAFDNLCEGTDMAWFSDGVSEEILQTVARSAALKVIGRGSSFQFRGADKGAAHVAAKLNATHVLDGSVRRNGAKVRIAAHLIECAGETTLWSDRFDRDLTDIFVLQDEIAAAVSGALKIAFAPAAKSETVNAEAYDLYLRARKPSLRNAATRAAKIRLLEQATSLAPRFARAWAYLASVRAVRLRYDEPDEPYAVMRAKVVEAAETALRLDPGWGEAYQIIDLLEPFGHYVAREALHRKALSAAPNDQGVLYWAFTFSCEVGRLREAMGYAKHAFDLDPMNPTAADSYAYMLDTTGRYEESRALWERFCAVWPSAEYLVANALSAAAMNADWDRFDDLVKVARERDLYTPQIRSLVWFGRNLRNPDPKSIKANLDQAHLEFARTGAVPFEWLAGLYRLGLTEEVFDLVEQVSFDFMFDPKQRWPSESAHFALFSMTNSNGMMRDPRFPRLCAKLGLCDYWVKTDRWPDCAESVAPWYDFKAECRRLAADNGRAST